MRARAPNLALGLAFAAWLGQGGCAEPAPQIAWRFSFARQELATRTRFVEAQVLGGGCAGNAMFTTRVTLEAAGAEPDRLKPGRYGFRGRAQDTSCGWFAEGCREVVLPRSGAIDVVLNELPSQSLDLTCMAATGTGELDAGAVPGAPPAVPTDRGGVQPHPTQPDIPVTTSLDAGEPTMLDAGTAPSEDAGGPSFDPRTPKCGALDQAVVACFDFDNTLADLSGHDNDALGPAATFEPGLSGQALRVGGTTVAVADHPSLDFATFTIELWLRIDGLSNLGDKTDPRSVLLDKNGQYLLAFEATGELRAQLHNGTTTATARSEPVDLAAGVWTYLAYAYDGTLLLFYKDGERVDSRDLGVALPPGIGEALHIGSGSPDTTLGFNGLIDALRISNVARGDALVCAEAGKHLLGGRCL